MTTPAISVRNLSKCYKLGTIGRHTLVDEAQYLWHKIRGKDPGAHFSKIGHTATEARKVEAEQKGAQEFWALKDVSFDVQPGEVIGIIGRNGAGKSTLLKILTRITEPTSGEAVINGRVSSLLEVGTGFHPELTGRENIYMNGTFLGMKKREIDARIDEIVDFSEIEQFIDTPVKRYSSGMYVRLAFAVAAHLDPDILLVDEVLAVGDMAFQNKCLGKMQEVTGQGRTVLFVSHNMAAVERLCDEAILISLGRITDHGMSESVIESYLVKNLGCVGGETSLEQHPGRMVKHAFMMRRVRLLRANGDASPIFHAGEDITFEVDVDPGESRIACARLQVHVINQRGVSVCRFRSDVMTGETFTIENPSTIQFDWKRCMLVPGRYTFNLHLFSSNESMDKVEGAATFEIAPSDFYGTGRRDKGHIGVLLAEGAWQLRLSVGGRVSPDKN